VLGEAELTLNDASSLATVEALVESKQLSSVRLGLDMLTDAEHPTLNEHLIRLLASDSSEIQREALGRIEKNPFSAALQPVQTLMESEDDAQVIGACIRTLCALDDDDLLNRVTPYLSDNLSETTIGAIVGLLRYGGISGVLAAGEHLTALEKSAEPTERQIVARIIGEVGVDNFYRPLIPLLQDENTAVRRAALISSSQVHHPRLLPYVIDNLANPLTRSAAMSALTATGQNLLPIIADALVDNLAHDEEDIIRMVRVCGQMKGQQVVNTLKPHIDHPDNDVQLAILQALQLADYHATNEEEIAEINKTMRGEVAHALRVLLAKQDLGEDAVYEAVHRSLDHEYEEARQRTFLLLCFIYDTRAILQAEERLMHGSRASQALALETLDVTLTSEQKQMVFPLVDSQMTTEQKIQQLQSVFDLQPLSLIERLTEIIRDPEQEWTNGWTRASVLYTVGKLKFLDLIDVVEEALVIEEHPIRETAVWALNALDPQRAQPHLTELCRDSNPSVGQLAAELLSNSTF
ncbi:MAG: HEAT repeat domain-containing protein, partial [Chloroflexota bacterium]